MTDTGQIPGEGQPENAGAQPGGVPVDGASGSYTFADPENSVGEAVAEDEELLMPSLQGAWGDAPPATVPLDHSRQPASSRGTGTAPFATSTPAHGTGVNGDAAVPPRRPLHLGPPVPEQSGAVRTLSDRGRAQPAPAPTPKPAAPAAEPDAGKIPHYTPPANNPEYLDAGDAPVPGEMPPANGEWVQENGRPDTETPAEVPAAEAPAEELVEVSAEAPAEELVETAAAAEEAVAPVPADAGEAEAGDPAAGSVPEEQDVAGEATLISEDGTATEAAPSPDGEPADGATAPEPAPEEAPEQPASAAQTPETAAAPEAGTDTAPEPSTETPSDPEPEAEQPVVAAQPAEAPAPAVTEVPEAPEPTETPEPTEAPEPTETAESTEPAEAPAADAQEPGPEQAEADRGAPEAEAVQEEASEPAAVQEESGQESEACAEPTPAEATAGDEPPVADEAPAGEAPEQQGPAEAPEPEADVQEPSTEEAPAGEAPEGNAAEAETTGEEVPTEDAPGEAAEEPQRPASPAPGFAEADREAVHRLMRERRDIRNGFRPDPIPDDVLLRVLEAAHTAPSVGHSQPWDFVVIRSEETRRTVHELAQRQREAYARSLPKARAKQFKQMKVEAILDTPVNIVVTADPTRGGRHTLGRHTQPQMAPYSSALAVENLWLAARAEGLGVGWVSFFDEREMVHTLDLPEHMEIVAYLCVGYVDEFPAEPELAQAGWSKRRPLSWVVHEDSYGRRVLPGAEPHDLLLETVDAIRPLDAKALGEAWERQKRMTKPSGALGMLEIISAQLCGLSRKCPPPLPEPAAVAVFAGDHGVHAQGVTPWAQEVTGQMVANFLSGGAVCNSFANQVGAEVCIVDVGVAQELPAAPGLLPRKVRAGTADMTAGPALTREEVGRAIEVGIETARDLVTAGNKALLTGEMGIANTTASAALIAACTGSDPAEITGRGTGINDETHARKVEVVRRALELHQPDPEDPIGLLAAVGGLEHAALVGLILGGASLRTPVILDGVSAGAAALVARELAPEALAACIAGHRSAEPGHVAALNKLGLRPLVDLDLRLGEGTGALLALPMVQSAARAMHEVATFDAAGVTEKN